MNKLNKVVIRGLVAAAPCLLLLLLPAVAFGSTTTSSGNLGLAENFGFVEAEVTGALRPIMTIIVMVSGAGLAFSQGGGNASKICGVVLALSVVFKAGLIVTTLGGSGTLI